MAVLTDAQLLLLGVGIEALTGIASNVRAAHCASASEWALSFIRPRYRAALAADWTAPESVTEAAAARASFTLLAYRGMSDTDPTFAIVRERYAEVKAWLQSINDGSIQLATGPDIRTPIVGGTGARRSRWLAGAPRCGCSACAASLFGVSLSCGGCS